MDEYPSKLEEKYVWCSYILILSSDFPLDFQKQILFAQVEISILNTK